MTQKPSQQSLSEQALRQSRQDDGSNRPENAPTANDGMTPTPRKDYPPSGAFEAEGHEPALRRSRER